MKYPYKNAAIYYLTLFFISVYNIRRKLQIGDKTL